MSDSAELARLADLHQRGALSDEEFARAKARLLNGEATARSSTAPNPALNVINTFSLSCMKNFRVSSRCSRASALVASSSGVSGNRMMNSSPP